MLNGLNYRTDKSLRFIIYFVNYGIHLVFCIFLSVGLVFAGGGGFSGMMVMFNEGQVVPGILSAICGGLMLLQLILGIPMLRSAHVFYRSEGHSLERAQGEAARQAAEDPRVQRAALNAARNV